MLCLSFGAIWRVTGEPWREVSAMFACGGFFVLLAFMMFISHSTKPTEWEITRDGFWIRSRGVVMFAMSASDINAIAIFPTNVAPDHFCVCLTGTDEIAFLLGAGTQYEIDEIVDALRSGLGKDLATASGPPAQFVRAI